MSTEEGPEYSLKETTPLSIIKKSLNKIIKFKKSSESDSLSEKIEEVVRTSDHDSDHEQRELILNAVQLSNDQVEDIMTPRTDIIAVPMDASIADIKAKMIESSFSKIPVFQESLDNVKGFVHIKDILKIVDSKKETKIEDLMRQVLFVPPSMRVVDLSAKMKAKKSKIAVVVDEYGGTDGLVTMDDLFDEVFGEFEEEDIEQIDENTYEVSARIKMDDLEEHLEIKFLDKAEEEEYDTLAGFLVDLFKKIPKEGESFTHQVSGVKFTIKEADPRFIKRVIVNIS